jgi:hypothetical protein
MCWRLRIDEGEEMSDIKWYEGSCCTGYPNCIHKPEKQDKNDDIAHKLASGTTPYIYDEILAALNFKDHVHTEEVKALRLEIDRLNTFKPDANVYADLAEKNVRLIVEVATLKAMMSKNSQTNEQIAIELSSGYDLNFDDGLKLERSIRAALDQKDGEIYQLRQEIKPLLPESHWVCEEHRDKEFPHDDCKGPGMLLVDALMAENKRLKQRDYADYVHVSEHTKLIADLAEARKEIDDMVRITNEASIKEKHTRAINDELYSKLTTSEASLACAVEALNKLVVLNPRVPRDFREITEIAREAISHPPIAEMKARLEIVDAALKWYREDIDSQGLSDAIHDLSKKAGLLHD